MWSGEEYCVSVSASASPVLAKYELIVRVSVFSVTKYFAVLAHAAVQAAGKRLGTRGTGHGQWVLAPRYNQLKTNNAF